MRILLHSIKIFLFTAVITQMVFAQAGKITGRVVDAKTNEPLPFVNIILTGTQMGTASDLEGNFMIINITPGVYSVKASAIGYSSVTVQNIKVSTGFTSHVDFSLESATVNLKDVTITAVKPMVQKDLTASTSSIGSEMISELPVTEIADVLKLQAGITTGSDGSIHMRGGRAGQIAYQIDGVPITDSYDHSNVIDVSTNSIQELQVISGAFNAEYGQAMSGVVNIVTKDGDNTYNGSVQAYVGSYLTNKSDIFWNLGNLKPYSIRNYEGSFSGPIIRDKLFFFTNARYYYNTGQYYGKQDFLTTDYSVEDKNTGGYYISKHGDSSYVAMNPNQRIFGQGKVTYKVMQGAKLTYNYIIDKQDYKDYNSGNRLTPDNNLKRFRKGYSNTLALNHAVTASSFYNLYLSYFYKDYQHYLFENMYTGNPNHPTNYVDTRSLQTPPYSFAIGGTDYSRFYRSTSTYSVKFDWTTQLNKEISIQAGGEYKRLQLFYHDITLVPMIDSKGVEARPFNVMIPPITTTNNNLYDHKPKEYAAYVQSKFEAFNLIFNLGVRFDAINPDGKILADPTDPNINNPLKPSNQFFDYNNNSSQDAGEPTKTVADREKYWFKDASIKYQVSPRVGLAFPISDKGVIHFSYGHFFQLPNYELMYNNPEFELGSGSGNQGLFGNADLKPQKTIKGEIGLQQEIGDGMGVDVTMFFEDFRDLTGTQTEDILVFGGAQSYSKYTNSDFGFSKGVVIRFEKRFGGGLATNVDYTYAVTKGNASNPGDARNAVLGGALPETFIAPLDWNQTHTLNVSIAYTVPNDWGFSLISSYYSGQPYTPSVNKNTRVTQNGFPKNSADKPSIFNMDIRVYKDFMVGKFDLSVFLKVYNLLDLDNARNVNGDTGDPYFTFAKLEAQRINAKTYYNTLNEYYTDPGRFSEPRRIEAGLTFNF
jgi:outer membrane receptor for ferrienterochelin and colicin